MASAQAASQYVKGTTCLSYPLYSTCMLPAPAACKFSDYTSDTFQFTYLFNNCPDGFASAQNNCTMQGGHLVSYEYLDEQAEVGLQVLGWEAMLHWHCGFTVLV